VMVMLTADHGVAPTPEFASEQGLNGQRTDPIAQIGDLLAKLSERFGEGKYLLTPRIIDGNIYFNHETLRAKQIDPETVAGFIRDWALDTGRFLTAFSRGQLLDGRAPGPLGPRVLNGFNPERSGDMVLVAKPFVLVSGAEAGTTHGSPFSYDTHIPVLFYGAGFKAGRYADEFYITDIAATLCAALRMNEPSNSIGKPLVKILTGQGPAESAATVLPLSKTEP
jgi:arylsulfatase A-like enzyme